MILTSFSAAVFLYAVIALILVGLVINVLFMIRLGFTRRHARLAMHDLSIRPWTLGQATTLIIVLLVLHTLLMGGIWVGQQYAAEASTTVASISVVMHTMLFHGTVLAAMAIIMRRQGWSWHQAFGVQRHLWRHHLWNAATIFLAAMPVVILAGLAYNALLSDLGVVVRPQDVVSLFTDPAYPPWIKIYLGVAALTVVPLAEELLFRGMILPIIIRYTTRGSAIVSVSILFALMHFHLPSIVPLFVIAIAFGYAYLHSGSLLAPIAMHAMFNAIGLGASLLLKDHSSLSATVLMGLLGP